MKRRDLLLTGTAVTVGAIALGNTTEVLAAKPNIRRKNVKLSDNLSGYYAAPKKRGTVPSVLVLMEAFGLNSWVKSICDRLAESGYAALAPDLYRGAIYEYNNIEGAIGKLKSLDDNQVMADLGKGLEFLNKNNQTKGKNIGVIGFCMGGRYTYLASATYGDKIRAAVSFYGGGIAANPDPLGRADLLDKTKDIQAPIMLIYGTEDSLIAAEEHQRIAQALSTNKKRYIINVFANAGHGFLSDRRDSFAPEPAKQAWTETLAFLKQNLG